MKASQIILAFSMTILIACNSEYKSTEAVVTDLEINHKEKGNILATFEYRVNEKTYSDTFEITVKELVQDSIVTPDPGTTFEIQYNTANPEDIKVDFQVKANYQSIEE